MSTIQGDTLKKNKRFSPYVRQPQETAPKSEQNTCFSLECRARRMMGITDIHSNKNQMTGWTCSSPDISFRKPWLTCDSKGRGILPAMEEALQQQGPL